MAAPFTSALWQWSLRESFYMKIKYGLFLTLAFFFLTGTQARAYLIYLQTENPVIVGEVTDKSYVGAWRLVEFGQDIQVGITTGGGGPPAAGAPQFSDFMIGKFLDKASALLLLQTAQRGGIGKVTVSLVTESVTPVVAYKIVLENVLISSIEQNTGDLLSNTPVNEQLKFNFTRITWTYIPIDPSTGKGGTPITTTYDLSKGQ